MGGVLGGRYQIGQEIAHGAIGSVWCAVDLVTCEQVAVKVLRSEAAEDPVLVGSFVAESAILAGLHHPSVVRHRDFVEQDGSHALVMDLVAGEDLRRRLRRTGPLPPGAAADLVAQLADALSYLHGRGVVHSDVKPGNLIVSTDGSRVRIIDFGAAHATAVGGGERPIHATPEYVAPEVVAGGRPSPASDVYALGIVLFELLCGRSPYRGGSVLDILERHGSCGPVPPPGLPPIVWPLIEACLAFDPAQRPDPRLVAARLRSAAPALAGAPPLAEPVAGQVTWWPRAAGTTTAVAKVRTPVRWVPLRATSGSAAAVSGKIVAVPIPMAVVGFEPEPAGPAPVPVLPVLTAGYGSASRWPAVSGPRAPAGSASEARAASGGGARPGSLAGGPGRQPPGGSARLQGCRATFPAARPPAGPSGASPRQPAGPALRPVGPGPLANRSTFSVRRRAAGFPVPVPDPKRRGTSLVAGIAAAVLAVVCTAPMVIERTTVDRAPASREVGVPVPAGPQGPGESAPTRVGDIASGTPTATTEPLADPVCSAADPPPGPSVWPVCPIRLFGPPA